MCGFISKTFYSDPNLREKKNAYEAAVMQVPTCQCRNWLLHTYSSPLHRLSLSFLLLSLGISNSNSAGITVRICSSVCVCVCVNILELEVLCEVCTSLEGDSFSFAYQTHFCTTISSLLKPQNNQTGLVNVALKNKTRSSWAHYWR